MRSKVSHLKKQHNSRADQLQDSNHGLSDWYSVALTTALVSASPFPTLKFQACVKTMIHNAVVKSRSSVVALVSFLFYWSPKYCSCIVLSARVASVVCSIICSLLGNQTNGRRPYNSCNITQIMTINHICTVEPQLNEVPRDRGSWFVISKTLL